MTPSTAHALAGPAAMLATLIVARAVGRRPARPAPSFGDWSSEGTNEGTSENDGPSHSTSRRPRSVVAERLQISGATVTIGLLAIAGAIMITGPLGAALLGGFALLVHRVRPVLDQRRRRAAVDRDLPDGIDLLVLGVHAGLTPRQSVNLLARSGPASIRPACAEVDRRTQRGQTFADSLDAFREILGERAGVIADVIATADRYGFPLGPVLDQLAAEARSARRRLDEADARRLPVRLSFPLVACTLPSFVLLAIAPAVIAALSSLGASAW